MYPRMKVRDDGDAVGVEEENDVFFAVEDFMPMEDPFTPGSNNHHLSPPPPLAKVLGYYATSVPMPCLSTSKGKTNKIAVSDMRTASMPLTGKKEKDSGDGRPKSNIRASPIPPPRAVLSSPDNDGKIGSMNRLYRERQGHGASPCSQVKVVKAESDKKSSIVSIGMKTRESAEKNRHKLKPINTGRVLKEAGNLGPINEGKGFDSTTIIKPKANVQKVEQCKPIV